ncbi:hypothetical protein PsYK624_114680 [Phanerochaete sordida]|uniref:Uncharacterized protein n=1 Tax=Phanerochaete sordida TaxID=48140 RepID=A0A9P3GHS8_9APHY|nr:hypothetical protein PsYK624_114680 [Phanerochaete sordida]
MLIFEEFGHFTPSGTLLLFSSPPRKRPTWKLKAKAASGDAPTSFCNSRRICQEADDLVENASNAATYGSEASISDIDSDATAVASVQSSSGITRTEERFTDNGVRTSIVSYTVQLGRALVNAPPGTASGLSEDAENALWAPDPSLERWDAELETRYNWGLLASFAVDVLDRAEPEWVRWRCGDCREVPSTWCCSGSCIVPS